MERDYFHADGSPVSQDEIAILTANYESSDKSVSLDDWISNALGESIPSAGEIPQPTISGDIVRICEEYARAVADATKGGSKIEATLAADRFPGELKAALLADGVETEISEKIAMAARSHAAAIVSASSKGLGAFDSAASASKSLEGHPTAPEWRRLASAIKTYAGDAALDIDASRSLEKVRECARDLALSAKPQYETLLTQQPLGGFASAELDESGFEKVLAHHEDSYMELDPEVFDALYEGGEMQLFQYVEPGAGKGGKDYTEYYGVYMVPNEADGTFHASSMRRRKKRGSRRKGNGHVQRAHSLKPNKKKNKKSIVDRMNDAKDNLREIRKNAFRDPAALDCGECGDDDGGSTASKISGYNDEEEDYGALDSRSFSEKLSLGASASPVLLPPSDRAAIVYSYARILSLSADPREARKVLSTKEGLRTTASEMDAAVAAMDAKRTSSGAFHFAGAVLSSQKVLGADEQTFVRAATARAALSTMMSTLERVPDDELALAADMAYASLGGPGDVLNKVKALVGRGLSSALVAFCRDTAKEAPTGDIDRYAAEQGSGLGAELINKLTSDTKRNVFERIAYVAILAVGIARSLGGRGSHPPMDLFPTLYAAYGSKSLGKKTFEATLTQKLFGIRQRVLDEISSRSLKYAALPGDSKTASANKRVQAVAEVSKLVEKTRKDLKDSRSLSVLLAVGYGIMDAALASSSSEDVKYYFFNAYFGVGTR
jgi:hypothetical protein